jgi:hypothetical protein
MIKEEKPYIKHNDKEYMCYQAGYTNPVQHKWSFLIDDIDSDIRCGEKIVFFGIEFTVTFTIRRESTWINEMFNNTSGRETRIEAWVV